MINLKKESAIIIVHHTLIGINETQQIYYVSEDVQKRMREREREREREERERK